jgi:hypothetical protein
MLVADESGLLGACSNIVYIETTAGSRCHGDDDEMASSFAESSELPASKAPLSLVPFSLSVYEKYKQSIFVSL